VLPYPPEASEGEVPNHGPKNHGPDRTKQTKPISLQQ